jgi:environmental stress-induced protein Ves
MATLIKFDALRPTLWKNGGGSTTEYVCVPDGAGLDDFDFRISAAIISKSGPFSSFPGVDRTLALVRGEGVTLKIDGQNTVVINEHKPMLSFRGEQLIDATVNAGTTMDFNVMTRRARCAHTVEIQASPSGQRITPKGEFCLLFFAAVGEAAEMRSGDQLFQLSAFDALVLDAGKEWSVTAPGATMFLVNIFNQGRTA